MVMVNVNGQFHEFVPAYILVEVPQPEELQMPRGRKPGSVNKPKAGAKKASGQQFDGTYLVVIGEGGPGNNRTGPDPVLIAQGLIAEGKLASDLTIRKMNKTYSLQVRMLAVEDAKKYVLPDITVIQPANPEDPESKEVRGKLVDVAAKIDTKRQFFGVGEEVFGVALTLVAEKEEKKRGGRPRKVTQPEPEPATAGSV